MKQFGKRLRKPGALTLITLCFLGSSMLRVADNGAAIAEEVSRAGQAADMAPGTMGDALAQCPPQLEPAELLTAIQDREHQLDAFEQRLLNREQVLRVSRIKIEEQLAALEEAEKKLAETIALADAAAENDINRLTSVYENMKPKAAATIFETMDVNFAAGFLIRMRPDAAAEILANLSSEAAYSVSVIMAGRNAGVPTE